MNLEEFAKRLGTMSVQQRVNALRAFGETEYFKGYQEATKDCVSNLDDLKLDEEME